MKPGHLLKPLIVSRHGETAYNRDGLILGHEDPPLLKDGEPVVRRLGSAIGKLAAKWGAGTILSSPLLRAAATAQIHSAILGWPVETRGALKELSAGRLSGRRQDEVAGGPLGFRQTWVARPPEGESHQDGEERLAPLLEEIEKIRQDLPVLIVGHGGINRSLLKILLGLSLEEATCLRFPHGLAYVIERGRVCRLGEDGTRMLGLFNASSPHGHEGTP